MPFKHCPSVHLYLSDEKILLIEPFVGVPVHEVVNRRVNGKLNLTGSLLGHIVQYIKRLRDAFAAYQVHDRSHFQRRTPDVLAYSSCFHCSFNLTVGATGPACPAS